MNGTHDFTVGVEIHNPKFDSEDILIHVHVFASNGAGAFNSGLVSTSFIISGLPHHMMHVGFSCSSGDAREHRFPSIYNVNVPGNLHRNQHHNDDDPRRPTLEHLPAFFSAEVGDVGGVVAGVPAVEEGGGFDGDAAEFGVGEAALPLVFSE